MSDATYRYEISGNKRALCQNTACKASGVKIQKGEFRFGTLVDFQGHSSWRWKHWGCVTPRQIANIQEQLGGLEGLDLDNDLDALDGYDDLTLEAQEKIKQALRDGHVVDEDWKGDPELNRPGQKGINKRTPKKRKKRRNAEEDEEVTPSGDMTDQTPTKPKAKKRTKKVKTEEDELEDDEPIPAKKKTASRKRKVAEADQLAEDEVEEVMPKKKSRAKKAVKPEASDEDLAEEKPKQKSRAKRVKAEENVKPEPAKPPPKKRTSRAKNVKEEPLDELSGLEEDLAIGMMDGAADMKIGEDVVEDVKPAKTKGRGKKAKEEEAEAVMPVEEVQEVEETKPAKAAKKAGSRATASAKKVKAK